MDDFEQGVHGEWAYSQLRRDQLPNYWRWAREYTLFDRFFASAHGPSFPNHLYTIAAQSAERSTTRSATASRRSAGDVTCPRRRSCR